MKYGRPDYDDGTKLGEIPADEPVFLIRSTDRLAVAVLDEYLLMLKRIHTDQATLDSVLAQRGAMVEYRQAHETKFPTAPPSGEDA